MKVLHSWIQEYFEETLPEPKKLLALLATHSFEPEGLKDLSGGDAILDLDVLPNRAADCLSHDGIAREIGAFLNLKIKKNEITEPENQEAASWSSEIQSQDLCRRHCGRILRNVVVKPSPAWLKEKLEALGQRSINNIVDATNYVMLKTGQPSHAFDFDLFEGDVLSIRSAKKDEVVITLDNKKITLSEKDIVLADCTGALDIAGIKGGKKAELTEKTKNILLSAASFDPVSIRKTSRKIALLTDASKRFENNISQEFCLDAIRQVTDIILQTQKGIITEEVVDEYSTKPESVSIVLEKKLLDMYMGRNVSLEVAKEKLQALECSSEIQGETIIVTAPHFRRDLETPQSVVEEVARLIGYDTIEEMPLSFKPHLEKMASFIPSLHAIRGILLDLSFDEIKTYVFQKSGDVEVSNPLASDKKALRFDLTLGMHGALEKNKTRLDLFGLSRLQVFEIGKRFRGDKEQYSLCLGVLNGSKSTRKKFGFPKEQLEKVLEILKKKLGQSQFEVEWTDETCEIHLTEEVLVKAAGLGSVSCGELAYGVFKGFSIYQHTSRDFAFWANSEASVLEITKIFNNASSDLVRRVDCFDVFEKEGKTSYAFRVVFQAENRTLTDDEVEPEAEAIYKALREQGFETR